MSDESLNANLPEDFEVFIKGRDGFVIDPNGLDIFVPGEMFFPAVDDDSLGFEISEYAVFRKTGEEVTNKLLVKQIIDKIIEISAEKGVVIEVIE